MTGQCFVTYIALKACKAEKQYLLDCKVSRYCFLDLHDRKVMLTLTIFH